MRNLKILGSLAGLMLASTAPAALARPAQATDQSGHRNGGGSGEGDPPAHQFRVDSFVLQPAPSPLSGYAHTTIKISTTRQDVDGVGVNVVLVREATGFFGYNGASGLVLSDLGHGRHGLTAEVEPSLPEKSCFVGPHARQIVMIAYQDNTGRHVEVHLVPFVWDDKFPPDTARCHPG